MADASNVIQDPSLQEDVGSAEPNTIEINPVQEQSPPVNEDTQIHVNDIELKRKLHTATVKGNWFEVKSILEKYEGLATARISQDGSTILDIAVRMRHNKLVDKILSYISIEQVLEKRYSDGSTALHIAAIAGNKPGAMLLIKKNKKLLRIQDHEGKEPLQKAYTYMDFDTIAYLFEVNNDDAKTELQAGSIQLQPDDEIGVPLLVNAITAKRYCLALKLLKLCPVFASKSDEVLMAIARNFPSGASFTLFESYKTKREQKEAKELLELVCNEIDKLVCGDPDTFHPYYARPILEAACQNADEVVREILIRSPEAIKSTNEEGYGIFQLAIIYKSEKVIKFILYYYGEHKNIHITLVDYSLNNILHLAGQLAPSGVLRQRSYQPLELHRDLLLLENLKKFASPTCVSKKNTLNETPDMVFVREHENLVNEGESWTKTIAKSCSIIATLIITLSFTALITIPGGSFQAKRTSLLERKIEFVFITASAFSLILSSTTLIVFLSIQTSRFHMQDFLSSLPWKLLCGLFCLLLSTTSMMISFAAILFLGFHDKETWMLAPTFGLASIPIIFFVALQLPLMVDLFTLTYLEFFGPKWK